MCGIIAASAKQDVIDLLMRGLQALSYRGYDSAGIAVLQADHLQVLKRAGKLQELQQALQDSPLHGNLGIAHSRWATHGAANEINAHPHCSAQDIAVVHNGIIENHAQLRSQLQAAGYVFVSQSDSEVIAHLLHFYARTEVDFVHAIRRSCDAMEGSMALAILNRKTPGQLWGFRRRSPLLLAEGQGCCFLASDIHAIEFPVEGVIYLEDEDLVQICDGRASIFDHQLQPLKRSMQAAPSCAVMDQSAPGQDSDDTSLGPYQHHMQKEIFQQPQALARCLSQQPDLVYDAAKGAVKDIDLACISDWLSPLQCQKLAQVQGVQIIACGTSYHAGLIAQYWFEQLLGIPTRVDIASEFRYKTPLACKDSMLLALSQSGETADTLAALEHAKQHDYAAYAAICNVEHSSLVRATDMHLMMHAGHEIGVAASKTFSAQLAALIQWVLAYAAYKKPAADQQQRLQYLQQQLPQIPAQVARCLELEGAIKQLAEEFRETENALFLGRGIHFPMAMEGALKLKEISYIHAESYPSGELKHGPLALIDQHMPVIVVAPQDKLWDKLAANIAEVATRGARIYLFADEKLDINQESYHRCIRLPHSDYLLSPFLQAVPLQLLAYHIARVKGTDIDQPRNLAKSVTVE